MSAAEAAGPPRARGVALALLSAAVLLLQLVQTRLFSVMLWHHLTYLVVTFTLLGFAAGGAILACRRTWLAGDVSRRLAWLSLLFAAGVVVAYAIVTRVAQSAHYTRSGIAAAAVNYGILFVPMIFAGMAVALALADAGSAVGRTYAWNMGGSALGCLLYVPALRALGGEGTVVFACTLALLAGALFAGSRRALVATCSLLAFGSVFLFQLHPTLLFEAPLAPSKAMAQHLQREPDLHVEASAWDPLCRIDVIAPRDGDPGVPRTIYQDGDASTVMLPAGAETGLNIFDKEGLAYLLFLDRAPKVLAIGIGGGIDILQAIATHRALPPGERVDFTGIEINPTTVGLMTGRYRAMNGDRYEAPGVEVVLDEGRSWLRRSDERYDIIQMTGTDTYAALASGSYVMSESYLYTAQAYDDYFAHLTDDGVISVLRFRFTPPREELRLAAIAVDALRRQGAASPADHVVMLGFDGIKQEVDGRAVGMDFAALLFRKRPFTPAEVSIYSRYAQSVERAHVMYAPGVPCSGPAADYFAAVRAGTDEQFRRDYLYNLDPVTDDNPFFFRYEKWNDVLPAWLGGRGPSPEAAAQPASSDPRHEYTAIVGGEPIGLILLSTVLGESAVLVTLLVLVPLLLFRREGLKTRGAGRWIVYFAGLGAGYMALEIVAMQRFVLFLGNPGYALTTVLVTFLLFSGWGAAVAGRGARGADPRRTLTRALAGVVLLVALLGVALPMLFAAALALPLPARLALAVVTLAPAAFLMGMPFPSGLALVGRQGAAFVPWAFGVNGGASVLASVVAILVAMAAGFSTVFVLAGAAYLLALLAGRGAEA